MIISRSLFPVIWKFVKENGWSIWLGFGLSALFGVGLSDIRWWVFSIPLILLVALSKTSKSSKKEETDKDSIQDGTFFVGKKPHKY